MSNPDVLGWLAAALMVATFACREARAMRPLAVATNLAFIGYGIAAALVPVLTLHLLLLPINLWHWAEARRGKGFTVWNECVRRAPCWALVLLMSSLLVACGGGGGDPAPQAQPVPPLQTTGIYRQWEFKRYLGRFSKEASSTPVDHNSGGEVQDSAQLGAYYLQPPRFDITPHHEIFSSASGMTYWAAAESPSGFTGPEPPIGAGTVFSQQQMFVKQTEGATLEYVVNNVIVQAFDANPVAAGDNDCPISMIFDEHDVWQDNPTTGRPEIVGKIKRPAPDGIVLHCDHALGAWVVFHFNAERLGNSLASGRVLLKRAAAEVEVFGSRNAFDWFASDAIFEQSWEARDFEVTTNANDGMLTYALLTKPMVIKVPLDDVKVGEAILVDATIDVQAYDFRQRESSAHAFFRDPGQVGGAELRTTGLQAVPMTARLPRLPDVDPTPACTGAADPARGTIAFERAELNTMELPGPGALVTLVREGGTNGEVSVLLQTTEGSASATADYVDATQRVRFRDGQTRRTVRIQPRLDDVAEFDETVLLRLAEPRGCAALGALAEAVLTIHDDDQPLPPPATFQLGGTASGLQGPGLVLYDRTQVVQLAVAADGSFTMPWRYAPGAAYDIRIVAMPGQPFQQCRLSGPATGVMQSNVNTLQVVCDPPVAATGIDTSFGTLGKVTAGLPGGARAIARQSTGHILATNGVSLVRFHPDGRLDAGFGKVDNLLTGLGADVADLAVGADDRIVVAGRILQPAMSPPFYQMAAARLNADGTRDTSFGSGGMATFRLTGVGESASRVLVQADGRVVLVGQATPLNGPLGQANNDIAVVRLTVDGALDASFGQSGAVLADALPRDFAFAAALQPDGRIFVAGRTSQDNTPTEDTLFTRLAPDGTIEPGFGRNPAYSPSTDEALDVALQADGKLVLLVAARSTYADILVVRLNADGSLDASFGSHGIVRSDVGPLDDYARAVAVQRDGKIIVAAQVSNPLPVPPSFALLRYASDGAPDAGFGSGGVLHVPFFGGNESANDLIVQPDGRIVAAGSWRTGLTTDIAMVRLVP